MSTVSHYSLTRLTYCMLIGLFISGCAGGTWNRWMGRKDEPSVNLKLAWAKVKETDGQFTEARRQFEDVLKSDPNNVEAILGMARLNVRAQRLVEAEEGFELAVTLSPKSCQVLSEVGRFYSEHKRYDRALELLREAQRMEPHEKQHHYNLAVALTNSGRVDEATPHFTEAVGEAAAHYNIGRLLIEAGNRTGAEEHFALALVKDPTLSDAEYFLAELRSDPRKNQVEPVRTAAAPSNQTMRQTSGVYSTRPKRTASPNARQPLYPHQGYEELPPPDELPPSSFDESASRTTHSGNIQQVSAESPLVMTQVISRNPPARIAPHRLVSPKGARQPELQAAVKQHGALPTKR